MNDKRDLLIHYDEENQKFIFYMVSVGETSLLRANAFDGVRPDVAFFQEKTPDEAERIMGSAVFSALDRGSISRVNIRDYKAESEAEMQRWIEELEIAAKNGDSEAQYDLYMHYHWKALKTVYLGDLQRAESLLLAAVDGGYARAIEAMKDWPLIKAAAERRIQRGSSV